MKYFIDTEFLEGKQDKTLLGFKYGETKPTIDLISIGIVAEDGREYYAISKDFNLKEAWNRHDLKKAYPDDTEEGSYTVKVYWIRDNVLKPIFVELFIKDRDLNKEICLEEQNKKVIESKMTYSWLKNLLDKYGKSNKQIAEEIMKFTSSIQNIDKNIPDHLQVPEQFKTDYSKPEFYGYYADYDWVVFCWLFGKMNDLPNGFPMYCIDLNQILEDEALKFNKLIVNKEEKDISHYSLNEKIKMLKETMLYPKQTNEHNALADARWNKELYKFLNTLK
jgi:hypothetical protein